MTRLRSRAVLILIAAATSTMLASLASADVDFIPLDEVERGMRGECVTEMDGGETVTVPVEVLGMLEGVGPEAEMILVRLDGPPFDDTGIIAGMSGSPVYVDGRLLGALAFGWPFAKEPIGGVTPFARMQTLAYAAEPGSSGARGGRPELAELVESWSDPEAASEQLLRWLVPSGAGRAELPLAVTGAVPPRGWLREAWQRLGWSVPRSGGLAAGVGAREGSVAGPLGPGSMVATIMVDGDAILAAGGTVTEVDGDQVWAFGHPNLGLGTTAMPLARAEVLTVLPSVASSFKFFTVGERIGTLRQDRERGAWGVLGPAPDLVPMDVHVNNRTYSYGVMPDPLLQPLLMAYVTDASYRARGRQLGEQTVSCSVELTLDDGSVVRVQETFASGDASALAASLVSAASAYVLGSPYRDTAITGATVRLEGRERLDRARIEQVQPMAVRVRRGEPLELVIRVRPHRAAVETVRMQIDVPAWLPSGRLDVVVADGAAWTVYDMRMRPTPTRSFADELKALDRVRPSTDLVVALERPELGLTMPGGTVSVPPSIAVGLSAGGLATSQTQYTVVGQESTSLPWSMSGAFRIRLTVDDGLLTEEGP